MGFLLVRNYTSAPTPEGLINSSSQDMALHIFIIITNALFIYIAKEICRRQEMKGHRVTTVQ